MRTRSKGWMGALVALAIVIIIVVVLWILGVFSSSYYAVYLNTGDLYFGSLSPFSSTLTNVWYIQKDAQSQQFALGDFSKVVWGSSGNLEINSDAVIWKTKLAKDSKIIPVIKGEASATQSEGIAQPTSQQNQAPQVNASTTKKE